MEINDRLRMLSRIVEPEGTVVTLTLDLSKAGILPPAARVFLKDQVHDHLLSEARPPSVQHTLKNLLKRLVHFVEQDLRPESNGLFLVAGPTVWEPMEVRVPLRNFIHVGRTAYLAPLLEAASRAPRALVFRLDPERARIDEIHLAGNRTVRVLESRERGGRRSASKKTGYPGRGGAEQDLQQRHAGEMARALIRETAAATSSLGGEPPVEAIYLVGRKEHLKAFAEALPADLRGRLVHGGPLVRSVSGLPAAVIADLEHRAGARRELEVQGFEEARAEGLKAALGPRDVLEHLYEDKVSRIFLDAEDPIPGVVCKSCGSRTPGLVERCHFCSEDVVPTSITQEVVAYALANPPLAVTFVPPGTGWLRDLGGMAAVLCVKGMRRKAVVAGRG